jgi:hypothetical protein
MSSYYLCDRCRLKIKDIGTYVLCEHTWPCEPKKVMVDHGHAGGRCPYDDPKDVCEHFEPKEKNL